MKQIEKHNLTANDKLLSALKDSNDVIDSINQYTNYDDEQLLKLKKFNNLTQFEKDLLYLCSIYKVIEVALKIGIKYLKAKRVLRFTSTCLSQ